jgi:hypothetical protein
VHRVKSPEKNAHYDAALVKFGVSAKASKGPRLAADAAASAAARAHKTVALVDRCRTAAGAARSVAGVFGNRPTDTLEPALDKLERLLGEAKVVAVEICGMYKKVDDEDLATAAKAEHATNSLSEELGMCMVELQLAGEAVAEAEGKGGVEEEEEDGGMADPTAS